jgi:hypothetical protein
MRSRLVALLLLVLLVTPGAVSAQDINVEWARWDAQIAVQQNNQMQVAETQEINVLGGTVRKGIRNWSNPVQLQAVYVILGNSGQPRALTQSNNEQPGTYTLSQGGNQTVLTYYLDTPQNAGSTFIVQLNYSATSPTTGMVDWYIVPDEHEFPVRSSTVRIQFPAGQAPDPSLVRISSGNGAATVNGNEIVIQSQGTIPPQQAFGIQIPFGAGVGAAGGAGQQPGNVPPQGAPGEIPPQGSPGTTIELPGLGTILLIICVVGFLLLWGGGSLLRGLLGGGGRTAGGPFGTGSSGGSGPFGGTSSQDPFGGSSSGQVNRGLRPSSSQDRDIGNVGNDKDRGGGASFG